MGILPGLKAFIAAVVGGIGNVPGAMLGAYILALADNINDTYISQFSNLLAFLILIAILLIRPTGILGEKTADKI
jgi:branched-chain amino acid transport system permease protein